MGQHVKRQSKIYRNVSRRLILITGQYSRGELTRSSFLRGCSYNIAELAVPIRWQGEIAVMEGEVLNIPWHVIDAIPAANVAPVADGLAAIPAAIVAPVADGLAAIPAAIVAPVADGLAAIPAAIVAPEARNDEPVVLPGGFLEYLLN